MTLKKYTCKIDQYTVEGVLGPPDIFFQHIAEVHKIGPPAPGNIKEVRAWIAEHVREDVLISWPQN